MPLSSSGIHITHQHFQKRYITLFLLKWLKSYQPSKYECLDFLSKTHFTFLLWQITFEPIEQKQSYIPHLKVLMCGMNACGAQWHGNIFILQYTFLKMALLLHKTALVNFPMATTVFLRSVRLHLCSLKVFLAPQKSNFQRLRIQKCQETPKPHYSLILKARH